MKHSYCIIGIFSGLMLLGAGCASSPAVETTPVAVPAKTPAAVPVAVPTNSDSAVSLIAAPAIDSTWKTFTSRSLNYSFQYPPKGTFAPTFAVKYVKDTDANIADDCYVDEAVKALGSSPEKVTVNGVDFCHTHFTDRATMHGQENDYWTTKKGSQYIIVTFTSKTYITDMSVIEGCQPGGILLGTATCKPFDLNAYHAMLSLIISTFAFGE